MSTPEVCKNCSQQFEITAEDRQFYRKIGVPEPTLCPQDRRIRRRSWRNEFNYHQSTCNSCNKKILSVYQPENGQPVYCQKCWWSDKWDPKKYGREYDFSKPFFTQFHELYRQVPHINMINDDGVRSENCAYCYNFAYGKSCYLVTTSWHAEDSFYTQSGQHLTSVIDCNSIANSELCYECQNCQKLYGCMFLQDSANCNNCTFGIDLIGCADCFGCIGLRNKSYYIFNKPYSKEEYLEQIKKYDLSSHKNLQNLQKQFKEFALKLPRRAVYQVNSINSTGDCLFNCKNVEGHSIFNGEDCKYYEGGADSPRSSYDILVGGDHDWCYESMVPDHSYMACFTNYCWKCNNVFYSDNCHSSNDLFGCIGLKNSKFCILNKQYEKEEYFTLRDKIVEKMKSNGEWGEYFPMDISPFPYTETVAQDIAPKPVQETQTKNNPQTTTIPDSINQTDENICNELLTCESTGKQYKIQKNEYQLYKKMQMPIPRISPEERRKKRLESRNSLTLYDRNCEKCSQPIRTSYSENRPEIVYCESCYSKTVS